MKISKKISVLIVGALLSVSTYVLADTEVICWGVTCQTCDTSAGDCSDQFPAPDSICDVEGVSCPT